MLYVNSVFKPVQPVLLYYSPLLAHRFINRVCADFASPAKVLGVGC